MTRGVNGISVDHNGLRDPRLSLEFESGPITPLDMNVVVTQTKVVVTVREELGTEEIKKCVEYAGSYHLHYYYQ